MSRGKRTVLCVDADAFGLEVRKLVLESFGYKVLTTTSAREALGQFVRNPVDAVILDYALEETRGDALARKMKALRPQTPVLMLSNMVYPPQSALPYIDAFATKGDSPQSLISVIESMLKKPHKRDTRAQQLIWAGGLAMTGVVWLVAKSMLRPKPVETTLPRKKAPDAVRRERTKNAAHA